MPLLEVAVDSIPDALLAERAGANRIELCSNLAEGGTTPSAGSMRAAVARLRIPVFAMIRPRGGDFLYDAMEIEVMLRDIEMAKQCGVHGIVSGALQPNGGIDEEGTEALVEAAAPLPLTFHRAFDQTRQVSESLDTCLALGVARVLTSAGRATALEGVDGLRELARRAGSRLTIVGGGGIRASHLVQLVERTGLREFHLGPRKRTSTTMRVHGQVDAWQEWTVLDEAGVREACAVAASVSIFGHDVPPAFTRRAGSESTP